MTTIPLTNPYTMNDAAMSFDADDYTAAIASAVITPNTPTSSTRTIGGNVIRGVASSEWSVDVGLLQDSDSTGLLRYLFDNEGETVPVTFTPTNGADPVSCTILIVPGAIGGTPGADPAQSSVSLPVVGRPTWAGV